METTSIQNRNDWYRQLPKMDEILAQDWTKELIHSYGKSPVMSALRKGLEKIREAIPGYGTIGELMEALEQYPLQVQNALALTNESHFKRVHNATGVVLHTNLGRAPLSETILSEVTQKLLGYSNLEYDLEAGTRGERYGHFAQRICAITGAEDCLVVNNNAAAVLLMLAAIGTGKEVIVSRGEQVEIGGKFRIPDIMDQSGCRRIEVGTTNKTRVEDYAEAITEDTAALLKVHTSNFKIVGFTQTVERSELVALGKEKGIPVLEDLGSGVLVDLSKYGLTKEPTVQDSLKAGVDLVTFSGDKLLGGPQAGIIVGKKCYIDRLKKHPLTRAMRIDKFTAAYLETLFCYYQDLKLAESAIPVLRMLSVSKEELRVRAERLRMLMLEELRKSREIQKTHEIWETQAAQKTEMLRISVVECESTAGGGSLPGETIPGYGVRVEGAGLHPDQVTERLRKGREPVILRTLDDGLLFDVRTLEEDELAVVAVSVANAFCKSQG
ncbi:MAG: L-seryl-tRNA(Sec) selenium transferase [Lachnospiraceae bacterium]|nr:L-seryl-tRNA(Sec) selenium transferase [bacterium]MDY5516609.1 L-seryl-tRNA(Sec) selenium transferase [Lachnospiraceae bacterium]